MSAPAANRQPWAARLDAGQAIAAWLETGRFPGRLIESAGRDRAFVTEVVLGVARWRGLLEWVVAQHARRRPDPAVTAFALVGLYQLLKMDTVPAHAAVYATVEAAKASPARHAAGFLNSLLRRAAAGRAALLRAAEEQPLAVRESHPPELVARWERRYGAQPAEALCRWNNEPARVTLCANTLRCDAARLLAACAAAGVAAEPHPARPAAFVLLPRGRRVPDVPGYAQGDFTVCDPSTLRAVELLDPQPGETVLDACAAPGGKAVLLAGRMRDSGRIVAADNAARRMARVRENVARLGLKSVETVLADATDPGSLSAACGGVLFDRILLDAPCTNTGVLQRRPDARWRFARDAMLDAARKQKALLDGVSQALRAGGRIVYSVCSIEEEEGPALVRGWLAEHPRFALESEEAWVPPACGTDGGYAAALRGP
jgi:16S rRNA (cytosine967-C5)-methyltransferase